MTTFPPAGLPTIAFLFRLGIYLLVPPYGSFRSKAEEFCKKDLLKSASNTSSMWFLGNLYVWHKQYNMARGCLESLLAQRKNHRGTTLLLSNVYFNLGDYRSVDRILSTRGMLRDKDVENFYLGSSLLELSRFKDAVKVLARYTTHHRKNWESFVRLGYACFKAGLYAQALESYEKAERLNPSGHEIKDSIALCREKLRGVSVDDKDSSP